MKLGISRILAGAAVLLAGLGSSAAVAAPVAVEVRVPAIRAIQTYNVDKKASDQAYVHVLGVAKGQPVSDRFPKTGTVEAAPKKQPVSPGSPLTAWKGELADGEAALVTVVLFQGDGKDEAKVKAFLGQLDAADKAAEGKVADAEGLTKAAEAVLNAQQEVVTKVKETFSRAQNTDHFGGLFNVWVWNNGGKLVKRLDPVGLTFGEHNGTDEKIYTKLKSTLPNVIVTDAAGKLSQQSLAPLSDDQATVRVKMLETEFFKVGEKTTRNVTDYLVDVQLFEAGKPVKWVLGGEETGVDEIHTYWNWAE